MSIILGILLLINFSYGLSADESELVVETALGSVEGSYRKSSLGYKYRAFEGIPYGKPPIDDLRFEPPERYGPWEGTLMAKRPRSGCVQFAPETVNLPERVHGDEDCLHLNIYTPSNLPKNQLNLLPVLFWIYGGSFQFGEGSNEGSSYIMNRNLIFVTFNYRLNILGFMSTGDGVVPGNMGLKDQSLALRWIHENIESFGGDPNGITLGGVSAGGSSTHFHYLSPMSRGLFQGGMSFSGTALDNWAQTEGSGEKARKVGSLMGCPTENTKEMVDCLKKKPAKKIAAQVGNFQPFMFNPDVPFGPVVEQSSSSPFLDRTPVEIIRSGDAADLPWISTVVSEEGLFPVAEFIEKKEILEELDEKWVEIAPHLLDFNFTVPQDEQASVAETIRHHYFGGNKIDKKSVMSLVYLHGHRSFSPLGARLMAKYNRSPVWVYYYNYRAQISLTDLFNVTGNYGVCHSDDVLLFIIKSELAEITDEPTLKMQKILLDMIKSFMLNGKPSVGVSWPPVKPAKKNLRYLHISGPEDLRAKVTSNFAQEKFWSSISFDENRI
ncbi:venom carboxylesterase-6 [Fopius arisanus]|uniref:Carboxylic ester hydrolase n=1 Tax=Fopius arisanus TaxID=64838 RepID=A0A9R1TNJ7_9HYME|nr:PREDICTED: venom carboxylesterase-6-like [Fopius arisanus]